MQLQNKIFVHLIHSIQENLKFKTIKFGENFWNNKMLRTTLTTISIVAVNKMQLLHALHDIDSIVIYHICKLVRVL